MAVSAERPVYEALNRSLADDPWNRILTTSEPKLLYHLRTMKAQQEAFTGNHHKRLLSVGDQGQHLF
jgi:hypothetical protein